MPNTLRGIVHITTRLLLKIIENSLSVIKKLNNKTKIKQKPKKEITATLTKTCRKTQNRSKKYNAQILKVYDRKGMG